MDHWNPQTDGYRSFSGNGIEVPYDQKVEKRLAMWALILGIGAAALYFFTPRISLDLAILAAVFGGVSFRKLEKGSTSRRQALIGLAPSGVILLIFWVQTIATIMRNVGFMLY